MAEFKLLPSEENTILEISKMNNYYDYIAILCEEMGVIKICKRTSNNSFKEIQIIKPPELFKNSLIQMRPMIKFYKTTEFTNGDRVSFVIVYQSIILKDKFKNNQNQQFDFVENIEIPDNSGDSLKISHIIKYTLDEIFEYNFDANEDKRLVKYYKLTNNGSNYILHPESDFMRIGTGDEFELYMPNNNNATLKQYLYDEDNESKYVVKKINCWDVKKLLEN